MIVSPDEQNIRRACELLRAGQVIGMPTETVYGLAASIASEDGLARIFEVKQRPRFNPLIVHLASSEQLSSIAELTPSSRTALARLEKFWPGPLSVLLPRAASLSPTVTGGTPNVAVRVPAHPVAQHLLRAVGVPLAAPSANRFGAVSPTTAHHVEESFGDEVPLVLDGGPCTVGLESTIVSLVHETPTLLRPGAVTLEMLRDALGEIALAPHLRELGTIPEGQPLAPGMLKHHYSPRTPLYFSAALPSLGELKRLGLIRVTAGSELDRARFAEVRTLSESGAKEEIARALFSALRELDQLGLDAIVIEPCDTSGLGLAIMDRLYRATAPKS